MPIHCAFAAPSTRDTRTIRVQTQSRCTHASENTTSKKGQRAVQTDRPANMPGVSTRLCAATMHRRDNAIRPRSSLGNSAPDPEAIKKGFCRFAHIPAIETSGRRDKRHATFTCAPPGSAAALGRGRGRTPDDQVRRHVNRGGRRFLIAPVQSVEDKLSRSPTDLSGSLSHGGQRWP